MFKQAVNAELLLLADKLSGHVTLSKDFYMGGGTALALQLGHRKSIDIDLFTQQKFNAENISRIILEEGGQLLSQEENTVHATISSIKVSFLYYPYKMLNGFNKESVIGKLQLASTEDIACMKIIAISQRADKKDFFDMYEILKKISPSELKKLLLEKYSEQKINCYHALKSFFFFEDKIFPILFLGIVHQYIFCKFLILLIFPFFSTLNRE